MARGEMADCIRAFEWETTGLGGIDSWPDRLMGAVELMLASPQIATLAVGPERVFLYNDEALKHYRARHPAVLGQPLAQAFAHEFHRVAAVYEQVFSGESLHVPAQPLDPDRSGTPQVFDAWLMPVRGADGAVIAAYMTGATVDDRRRAETALRDSEDRLRQFGEASQDIIWIRDASTLQWVYLTPAFETTYGLSREQALAGDDYRNWQDLIVPEDRDHARASISRVGDGEWVTFEYRIRRPNDGTIRWLRDTDFPITDASGAVTLIGGIGHDFTEVRDAELRLKTLVEGMPQLLWRAVGGGEWTWASPQWTHYTGQTESDHVGWGWLDALHPDDRSAAAEAWSHAVETGRFEVECRLRRTDGVYRWFQTRGAAVRDPEGTILEWLGTSTDVHDLREMQERQKVLVAELQHRTRNLMGVVRSMGDKTVRSSVDLADFRIKFRDRMGALSRVQGLLSRMDEHDRVTFDDLIHTELEAMTGDPGRVTVEGPSGIRLRSSTVQTLALAIHELATNALKYGALAQPAGRLAIRWQLEPAAPDGKPWLHIDWRERGVTMPPPDRPPSGSGQGRELIERALPYQLGARTAYTLGPDGAHCTISVPVSASTLRGDGHG